jgi:outer membrane usher protein FimD/PapC
MTVSSILLAHVSATSEKFTAPLDAAFKSSGKSQEDQTEQHYKSDGFLNLNVSHERDNKFAFGSRNCSVVGLTPLLSIGKLVVEADFFFGSFQSFNGWIKGERYLSRTTPQKNRSYLHNNFNQGKKIKKALEPIMAQALDRAHFYRNYTRIIYTDQASNFRVVVGDTKVSNTVGFQQPLSGGGLSIFRQKGNGSVIGAGSPLVITAASKVECKMGNDSVATMLFAPGVYSIDDMPEEAKLPGVSLKISDQVKRREVLKVEYFGGYGTLAEGMNDFDLTIVCDHHWNLEDPHRIRYQKKPRYSGNYRYGLNDNMTLGGGLQVHENSYLLDCVMIFDTDLGKIAPNIAYSDARKTNGSKKRAAGAGIFYSIPENELGIFLETFAATKGKHFGDLGRGEEREEAYNKFIEKYFSDNDIREKLKNSTEDSSSRQITARLYSKPIEGFVPALIFNGKWSKTERLREYTLSLTKAFDFCSFTVSGGLTYDDPDKGRNLRSPDRRLAIVCNIKIGTDLSVGGDYVYYDEEKRRSHIITTYAPHEIKGLEFGAEMTSKPGFSYPYFSAKYNSEYFNLEAEESIINTYEDKEAATVNSHSNRQKLCFGTNISPNGIRALQKVNFNVLRGVE